MFSTSACLECYRLLDRPPFGESDAEESGETPIRRTTLCPEEAPKSHHHTYGGWERFFAELGEGKLLATRCPNPEGGENRMWLPSRCDSPDGCRDMQRSKACVAVRDGQDLPTPGRRSASLPKRST